MKTKTLAVMSTLLLCLHSATATVIITNTFAAGNGSFEYDASGVALTGSPVNNLVGKWSAGTFTLGAQQFRIDSTRITTSSQTDGSYSMQISQPGVIGGYSGGWQNTGYVIQSSDTSVSLDFDWRITNAQVGQTYASVALFTSSDDTLTGTLTEIGKLTFGGASQATYTNGVINASLPGASIGKQLFIAFARESNINAAGQRIDVDSVNLTVIPEPATLGLVAAFGGGVLFIRRRLMM